MELRKLLVDNFVKERIERGRLERSSRKCYELFRSSSENAGYTQEKFIVDLRKRGRALADVEVHGQFFQLKRAYEIWDKESLKQFMLGHMGKGIVDDEKLRLCYLNVKSDMDQLIEEGWVREVKIEETKRNVTQTTRVFFPRHQDNSEIEFSKQELPENCHEYLADLW